MIINTKYRFFQIRQLLLSVFKPSCFRSTWITRHMMVCIIWGQHYTSRGEEFVETTSYGMYTILCLRQQPLHGHICALSRNNIFLSGNYLGIMESNLCRTTRYT